MVKAHYEQISALVASGSVETAAGEAEEGRWAGGIVDRQEIGGETTWAFTLRNSSVQLATFFSKASSYTRRDFQVRILAPQRYGKTQTLERIVIRSVTSLSFLAFVHHFSFSIHKQTHLIIFLLDSRGACAEFLALIVNLLLHGFLLDLRNFFEGRMFLKSATAEQVGKTRRN